MDALFGVDVELRIIALAAMNAVHRAGGHTGLIFDPNTGIGNDIEELIFHDLRLSSPR